MDTLLVKIFATALTLSQVTTAPDQVKTQFDRAGDQQQVVQLLRAGCAHMRKAFDIEAVNLDDLIATAMDDPQALTSGVAVFRGINFSDLFTAYRQFCKNETVEKSAVDIGEVIDFYNKAVADLPDPARLKGRKLPGATAVLDGKGARFAELFESDQRRISVPLSDVPKQVQQAFISAEDKRFYEHHGIDERSLIRAFIGNLAQSGRPQGGSTITQQVVKNLLVGEDLTYERKIREMILASRVEQILTKQEILELYLNSTYLGRGSWGIEMAARSYFGKPARALDLGEGALLAGLTKGPTYFGPDRHPDRAQERLSYVLDRMREDGAITADEMKQAARTLPTLAAYVVPRRDTGFHFVDQVAREAKAVGGIDALTADSYIVHSTIQPELQRATEAALQEGLARFEIEHGRVSFQGVEANLADAVRRIQVQRKAGSSQPAWQEALAGARLPLYDVHWPGAVVLDKGKGGETRVGLTDGRILPLSGAGGSAQRNLKLYDVVFVHLGESRGKAARADLRVRPHLQGAALVLENKTGRILAMAGGFSYPVSQLNRATQSQRQPGSALKPLTYLAALQAGLQPNTLVRDQEITLPPIGGGIARDQDYWTPKNYDGGGGGVTTLRRALENSKNLATVNLLDGGIANDPQRSLDRICALALEAQIYHECVPYYPFVLGAQPVRPIDLAAFYAAIANEGARPSPHTIESIERDGRVVYRHQASLARIGSADQASFFQLKMMMQGVLQRGTAHAFASLAPYVAGKTGTTDGENDAWFVGFSNDVTVAVWVGYDNADGKRRTLGSGQTGASVAAPIFAPIMQAVWATYAPKAALNPPSPEARRLLVARSIDLASGDPIARGDRGFVEYFRRDASGEPSDTQFQLVSRDEYYAAQEWRGDPIGSEFSPYGGGSYPPPPLMRDPWRAQSPYGAPFQPPPLRGFFGSQQQPWGGEQRMPPPPAATPRSYSGPFWNWR
jgi:penicillin-binding protein 1A